MIFEIINLMISLIIWLFVVLGIGYFFLFVTIEIFKTKGKKREVKLMKDFQSKIKDIAKISWSSLWMFGSMFVTICLSALLAIGIKPIIYKLNYPLGEGYATFTSYVIAICLYIMFQPNKNKENSK